MPSASILHMQLLDALVDCALMSCSNELAISACLNHFHCAGGAETAAGRVHQCQLGRVPHHEAEGSGPGEQPCMHARVQPACTLTHSMSCEA